MNWLIFIFICYLAVCIVKYILDAPKRRILQEKDREINRTLQAILYTHRETGEIDRTKIDRLDNLHHSDIDVEPK